MKPESSSKSGRRCWIAHGSEWAEYEDLLIGDRDGLLELKRAIDEALLHGEAKLSECDTDFLAVKLVDAHPGKGPYHSSWRSRLNSFITIMFLLFLIFCMTYGCVRLPDLWK
jgi:hypothetical protein